MTDSCAHLLNANPTISATSYVTIKCSINTKYTGLENFFVYNYTAYWNTKSLVSLDYVDSLIPTYKIRTDTKHCTFISTEQ
jgi:hypothetical protein